MLLEPFLLAVLAVLLFAGEHLLQLRIEWCLVAFVALALVRLERTLESRADLGRAAVDVTVLPYIWFIVPAVHCFSVLASVCLLHARCGSRFVL